MSENRMGCACGRGILICGDCPKRCRKCKELLDHETSSPYCTKCPITATEVLAARGEMTVIDEVATITPGIWRFAVHTPRFGVGPGTAALPGLRNDNARREAEFLGMKFADDPDLPPDTAALRQGTRFVAGPYDILEEAQAALNTLTTQEPFPFIALRNAVAAAMLAEGWPKAEIDEYDEAVIKWTVGIREIAFDAEVPRIDFDLDTSDDVLQAGDFYPAPTDDVAEIVGYLKRFEWVLGLGEAQSDSPGDLPDITRDIARGTQQNSRKD